MSELKVYHCNEWHNEYTEFYLKYDVDKVIAEKDKVIDYARCLVREDIKIIRRHKYKRCLAMAKWCMTEYIQSKCLDFTNTEQWYWRRWHIRWRNLAKKFKEAK